MRHTARSASWANALGHVGLREGFIRRGGRPADYDQKDIQHKQRNGNVVEQGCLAQIGPKLIGSPEEKGDGQQDRFDDFQARRSMRRLVDKVSDCDQGERKCGKNIMRSGGKEPRRGIPDQQNSDACERDHAKEYRKDAVGAVQTSVHTPLSPTLHKETVKEARGTLPKVMNAKATKLSKATGDRLP